MIFGIQTQSDARGEGRSHREEGGEGRGWREGEGEDKGEGEDEGEGQNERDGKDEG